jgi:uncharacterized protein
VIAILGDTHLPRGKRRLPADCVELLRGASLVLHVGDVVAASVLAELRVLGAPVAAVHGNMDDLELRAELPARLVVEGEGLRFGLVHSGGSRAGRHARLRAWFPDCDAVCYGHSHQPEIAYSDGVWILNPGSPTDRRRAPTRTMIVLRHRKPELVDLGAR